MKRLALILSAAVTLAAGVLLAGCGTHASGADPTSDNTHSGTNQHVIQQPYGFRNVSFSCFGVNGVYVTSAGADDSLPSSVTVVPSDPNCRPNAAP